MEQGEGKKRKGKGGEGGDGGGGRGGKHKKAKYVPKSGSPALPSGAQGIMVTCETHYENKASKEAVMLIEEHYDKLAGASGSDAAGAAASTSGGAKDISALLAQEVAELKDKSKQRFKPYETGVSGCMFFVFPPDAAVAPLDVVLSILREAKQTKTLRARHCNRLLPITHTCYASLKDLKEMAPKVVEGHFPAEEGAASIPFAIDFEHRSSDKFDRMDVINAVVEHIKCPPHKVNLNEPAKSVLVQMVRNACGCAVVTDYRDLARFNIKTLTGFEEKPAKKPAAAAAGAKAATPVAEAGTSGTTKEEAVLAAAEGEAAAGKEDKTAGEADAGVAGVVQEKDVVVPDKGADDG